MSVGEIVVLQFILVTGGTVAFFFVGAAIGLARVVLSWWPQPAPASVVSAAAAPVARPAPVSAPRPTVAKARAAEAVAA